MTKRRTIVSSVFCATLAIGCAGDKPGDNLNPETSTSSMTTGHGSGSVTSAPSSISETTVPTTSDTMSESSTAGTAGEPCTFLSCDDMFQNLFECDNFAQDCPEGQKCAAYISGKGGGGWDALKCVDVTGTDKPGDTCVSEMGSGVDSCIEGAMCWEFDVNGVGICHSQCTGSIEAPSCEFPGYCTIGGEGALDLCFGYCNPLLQDCPKPGDGCYPDHEGFNCSLDTSGATGQSNDPCDFQNACKKGLMCADSGFIGMGCAPDSTSCCTPFCSFPGGGCPNPDQQCVQYFSSQQFPPGDPYLDIGVCGLPG